MSKWAIYGLAVLVVIADQISKQWVLHAYSSWPYTDGVFSRPLIPGLLSLTFVNNTGGAFGILPTGTLALAFAAFVTALLIVIYTARVRSVLPRLFAVALALPLGGAVGNLLDRVRLRYVVDFLDAHIGVHQWPVFNIADSAICAGIALLAIYFWRQPAGDNSAAPSVTEEAPHLGPPRN